MFGRVSYQGRLAYGRQEAPELLDGTWTYSNSMAVLDEVGLKTIAHYIQCSSNIMLPPCGIPLIAGSVHEL